MSEKAYNVLFICAGNSARSVLAESLKNRYGGGRFHGYSAGSFPKGTVHPNALDLLRSIDFPIKDCAARVGRNSQNGRAVMDFVFTVCDQRRPRPARSGLASR